MANKKVSADIVRTGIGGITIQGDLLYKGASDLERLPKGTAAQALTMNSGATAPEWTDAAAGGAWTIIGTAVADDDASLTITGLTSTYDTYACFLNNIVVASDGANVYIRVGDAGGIDSGASDYEWVHRKNKASSSALSVNSNASTPKIRAGDINTGNAAGESYGGQFYLYNAANASLETLITGIGVIIETGGSVEFANYAARRKSAFAVDRIEISLSSGNITSGRFTVWGLKHT